jgi:hypothetical protein
MNSNHKHVSIDCNGSFLLIKGSNQCGAGLLSSKELNTYLHLQCTNKEFGNCINSELLKCKHYEYSKDMFDFLREEARINKKEQFQYLKRIYGYKKENDVYRNMMLCWVDLGKERLKISPSKRKKGPIYHGLDDEFDIISKEDAPAELIGAAARFAFTRCQGKGRDIVVKALFPNGEPNSLEEYLASVNSDYKNWVSPVKVEKIFICDTNPAITLLLRNDCQTSFGLMNDKKRYFIHHGGFGSIPGVEAPKDYKGIPLLKGLYINALEMSDDEIIQALEDSFGCNVTVEDVE